MWVFRNNSFVSVVEDRDDVSLLWVRARAKGDIERFFGRLLEWDVERTPMADYLYRVCVPRHLMRKALVEAVDAIDYDNFKSSIPKTVAGDMRHTYYMRVWSAMMAFQHDFKRRFKK